MTAFVNTVLLILEIISLIFTSIFAILGIYDYIVGPAGIQKLFEKLHIPLSYNQFLIIGLVCMAVMFTTHFIRKKLSGMM